MPPRQTTKPVGHDHRVNQAKHRPEAAPLRVCDVAWLLNFSPTAVCARDAQLRPAMLGLKAAKARRYSWGGYLAYLASVGVPATA